MFSWKSRKILKEMNPLKWSNRSVGLWTLLFALVSTVASVVFGWRAITIAHQSLALQQKTDTSFFSYPYDSVHKLFRVQGTDREDIQISACSIPEYENGQLKYLVRIGGLANGLSLSEIESFYSNEIGVNNLLPFGKDFIECELFRYFANSGGDDEIGIPVIVKITYRKDSESNLTETDGVILRRLDTPEPSVEVASTSLSTNEEISDFLQSRSRFYLMALQEAQGELKKFDANTYHGELRADDQCGVMVGQPPGGYK